MAATRWVFGVKLILKNSFAGGCGLPLNREEWRSNGRQHADAVCSLSWRESMRKLLLLVEELASLVTAPPLHPDSVLLITLDSCRYDSFRRSTTPAMDRVGPLHRAMAPSHFTFGSHAAIFKGFCRASVRQGLCSTRSWPNCFVLAHAGWPGKGAGRVLLQGPSIIEGFRRQGYRTVGSGAVGWFDPATETGRCLTAEFERFFIPAVLGSWLNSSPGLRRSVGMCRLISRCFCF